MRGGDLDAIAISHCHYDHVGSLPVAMRCAPRAHVLMSELSYFLVERVLHHCVNVMKRQRDKLGLQEDLPYTHENVDALTPRFQGFKYNREIEWAANHNKHQGSPSPTLEFYDAGHTLGSAGMAVRGQRETLFYTGDVCFHDQTILKGARFEDVAADVLIMETTRGNRELRPGFKRQREIARLRRAIQRGLENRSAILIPAFALGRTQEILALLVSMMEDGDIGRRRVFVGGLGRVFTEIYDLEAHRTHREYPSLQLHEALDLVVLEPKQIERVGLTGGGVFVLTAGMMSEGSASHDLAARMIGEKAQAIFFVGYADPETPGGRLRAAKHGETFHFSSAAGEMRRLCHIEEFDLTAHANREEMLAFVGEVEPRAVLLTHGEPDSQQWFADQISARYPRMQILRPGPGDAVEV